MGREPWPSRCGAGSSASGVGDGAAESDSPSRQQSRLFHSHCRGQTRKGLLDHRLTAGRVRQCAERSQGALARADKGVAQPQQQTGPHYGYSRYYVQPSGPAAELGAFGRNDGWLAGKWLAGGMLAGATECGTRVCGAASPAVIGSTWAGARHIPPEPWVGTRTRLPLQAGDGRRSERECSPERLLWPGCGGNGRRCSAALPTPSLRQSDLRTTYWATRLPQTT